MRNEHRFFRSALLALLLVSASTAFAQSKRPLTHKDYAGWHAISSQVLSHDGKFLAYGLFPEEGDGEVIVRNLETGTEWRQPAGATPPAAPFNPESATPPPPRSVTITYTPDSHFVIFSTFPSKADKDKARKEKKKPEEMPKNGMVIMNLSDGSVVRLEQVKSFQVPEKASNAIAYLQEREPEKPAAPATPPKEGAAAGETSQAATSAPVDAKKPDAKKEYGGPLVLRVLASKVERTFPDVLECSISKDGATLVYAVSSKKEETNGIFAVNVGNEGAPRTLLAGPGKYEKLAWDEKQTELAFVSDRDDAKSKPSKFKLYLWARQADTATELVSSTTPGFREGFFVSDKGSISFSRDGKRVFFGCAPPPPPEDSPDKDIAPEEKVTMDLWNWKDGHVQPMQKIRATQEKNRTYRAVYHLAEKKLVQLADFTMGQATPTESGLWALGADDREYEPMYEYDAQYNDYYLVNTLTGERKLLVKKLASTPSWSPNEKYVAYFSDKDWVTLSIPDGKASVVTANRGVNFWREDHDTPNPPPPYSYAPEWSKDSKYLFLNDEFDIWRITPDGRDAVNLTRSSGRISHLEFRYVRINRDDPDPDARWIDPAQPMFLEATNKDTYDTGLYRTRVEAKDAPEKLVFAQKAFTQPIKARDTDVMLLSASTVAEFPDLLITDSSFAKLQKVTNSNPEQSQINWATAGLIHYRNADGVPLKAALYRPENFDPNKKYPLLVYIYEKLSQDLYRYEPPAPSTEIVPIYYVSNGYLVLKPDIVYTTGHPGQSALKCVLPAIDAVVAQGIVDEKAIGIEGHSWGGYQIAYMVTQTNRFRAAEAGAPVSNMISAYGGIRWGAGMPRQFQYERTQSRIGDTLWNVPLRFVENSPIFNADRISTPLLILHNDADGAVPWYQGIEYFMALRRLGKEAYLLNYNGEDHGLIRRADQIDFTIRMQQFFDHFLKGAPAPDWMTKGVPYIDRETEKDKFKKESGVQ
jgi:dipeptidyl aminopeptidase/acylaminoacyl peptidase